MKEYPIYLLPDELDVDEKVKEQILKDYERFGDKGLPDHVEEYILEKYKIDVTAQYGPFTIKNPFGKSSGQLSCNINQVKADLESGIGFVVLKTVIAQDESEHSNMAEWKVKAPKMVVEEILSKKGQKGYTVTWKGRGWDKSFQDYLKFMEEALSLSKTSNIPVIPSCKYHLPNPGEAYNEKEYRFTTNSLLSIWQKVMGNVPMALEQDFSPTLSGSDINTDRQNILDWLINVPRNIKKWCQKGDIVLGLKLMNALYDDDFQIEMLKSITSEECDADYAITFNRLFDPNKVFEGKKGVAYGGWDLSDRNLRVLSAFRKWEYQNKTTVKDVPLSATGNINSGKLMIEYGLRGCCNGQMHTYFQLPQRNYRARVGTRVQKVLHELYFNPENGLVAVMEWLRAKKGVNSENGIIKWREIYTFYRKQDIFKFFGKG
ncbi:MAG: hypothetical protein PWR06_2231 [Thermoanaerobacteraceae bacterium]|jgi:hypothetical protein|uniref:Uncharacterized protein n=1 Tax=Biomaibacter acetigenes TaxID=2316383 RepID=A0A3G2R3L3_9FIRM|nr:hypothetical protein [Biomaibacter acetigenes]AYO30026.1 hypothetical protein D2962_04850 [Biomaibacter acetigenes]MDK2879515.1 hypothetical protein [Thermoanaerobacteraceae bacterium]MDN5311183.1 hypothetical protein [Thermoanaerobacteraceae bacterium]RKL63445.1 hypothetical protein DXT63_06665 [Thermoanaerobacteraceae bacterium SP2]